MQGCFGRKMELGFSWLALSSRPLNAAPSDADRGQSPPDPDGIGAEAVSQTPQLAYFQSS